MAGRLARLPLMRCRGRWSGLPLSLGGPPRQAAAQPPRSLHLPPAALPCGPHRPESAAGGSGRRKRFGNGALFASGGVLFTAEKCRKRAGGCGLGPLLALRHTSQGEASPRPLRSTGPSRPILPAPSRLRAGQWNRGIVTATVIFAKAAQTAPERGVDFAHGSFYVRACVFAVDNAHCAFAPRSGLS